MKKYKRLKLLRIYAPILLGFTIGILQNIIIGIILLIIYILIEIIFIQPKLPFPFRRKRQVGEVFIIEPMKNKFFFAKIVRVNVPINDPIMNGGHLMYIFSQTNNPLDIPEYLDPNKLVIPPQIIDDKGWRRSKFQTVGFKQVTNQEREISYGFWDIITEKFVNEEGKELKQPPHMYDYFGISSYGAITDKLKEKLVS